MAEATTEQRAAFADRSAELFRLFKKGSRDPELVLAGLQGLIDTPPLGKPVLAGKAKRIMGRNFRGIGTWEAVYGPWDGLVAFTENIPFSAETLRACRETHLLVFCGPLSVCDVRNRYPKKFYECGIPWFAHPQEEWAHVPAQAGWYLIRKSAVPYSAGKSWQDQQIMLSVNEFVPNAAVMAQALVLQMWESEVLLFVHDYARVSDTCPAGRICYGTFPAGGGSIIIGTTPTHNIHGVASAIKPIT